MFNVSFVLKFTLDDKYKKNTFSYADNVESQTEKTSIHT